MMKLFGKGLLLALLVLGLASFAFATLPTGQGCCIDTIQGCREVFGTEEIAACAAAGFEVEDNLCVARIDGRPGSSNPVCSTIGCCTFPDGTFQSDTSQNVCLQQGGDFTPGVCEADPVDQDNTCAALNGYWCLPENSQSQATILTNLTTGRPEVDMQCYSLPCEEDGDCPGTTGPKFCTDGVDNSGNCKVDTADDYCQATVRGTVVNHETGRPVSNVRIRIYNEEQRDDGGFYDQYVVFSIGADGSFLASGLSAGRYRLVVEDSFYELQGSNRTFEIRYPNQVNHHIQAPLRVVPRNAARVFGTVTYNNGTDNLPVSNAIVSILNTDHFAITDSEGGYSIPLVRTGRAHVIQAFKEAFFPSERRQFTLPQGTTEQMINLVMDSNECEFNSPPPVLQNVGAVRGRPYVDVNFTTGGCFPTGFQIYRCTGAVCSEESDFGLIATLPNSQFSFRDEKTAWQTTYSYFVRATFGADGLTRPSSIVSITTGNPECEGRFTNAEYCQYDRDWVGLEFEVVSSRGVYCDANNRVQEARVCDGNTQCIEQNSGSPDSTTSCRQIGECAPGSANLFGLFFRTPSGADSCSAADFCVLDTTRTNVDFCFSCKQYGSCSSYRSEDACTQNACLVGNCTWITTDETLNQGICRDTTKNECGACNTPFNAVFGACSQDVCTAFGSCSLSVKTNECLDCAETTCYDYPDRDSCTGGAPRPVLNLFDNSLSRESQDICGLGSCVWDEVNDFCYKDRVDDGANDCSALSFDIVTGYLSSYCELDNEAPETTAAFNRRHFNPSDPVRGEIKVSFSSRDTLTRGNQIFPVHNVFFCLTSVDADRCLNVRTDYDQVPKSSAGLVNDLIIRSGQGNLRVAPGMQGKEFILAPGKNVLRFYAKDPANNVEIVREEFFYVDVTPPEVDFTIIQNPNYEQRNTDLLLVGTANEAVFCQANLHNCEDLGSCDPNSFNESDITQAFLEYRQNQFSPDIRKEIQSVPDGSVMLGLVCTDISGNIFRHFETIVLNTDDRIQNPQPLGTTDKGQVRLRVSTPENVQCKYGTNINTNFNNMQGDMTSQFVDGMYEHTSQQLSLNQDGTYTFYVRCNYDPIALQQITFTIDRTPPTVTAHTGDGLELTPNESRWVRSSSIRLECEDAPENGFGCAEVRYCLKDIPDMGDSGVNTCTPNQVYNGTIQLAESQSICFQGQENTITRNNVTEGGLISRVRCVGAKLDLFNPIVFVDPIPASTRTNQITLTGSVYGSSIPVSTISYTQTSGYGSSGQSQLARIASTTHAPQFTFVTEIDFSTIEGEFLLLYGESSSSDYRAVVFDKPNDRVFFESGTTTSNNDLPLTNWAGIHQVKIEQFSNSVELTIQDISGRETSRGLSSQSEFRATQGSFGFLRRGTETPAPTIRNTQILLPETQDLEFATFVRINNQLRATVNTDREFSISLPLTTGTPAHGNKYDIVTFADSVSGRRSVPVTRTIFYDLSGPIAQSVSVAPTIPQNGTNYIEYRSNATITAHVTDDFSGVYSVSARIGSGQFAGLEFNPNSNRWVGEVSTSDVPIGNHSVELDMRDGLRNRNVQEFEGAVLIENRIDPVISPVPLVQYFNTSTPLISISTEELAQCRITYRSSSGQDHTIHSTSSNSFASTHNFQIPNTHSLSSEENFEVPTTANILCTGEGGRSVTLQLTIVVDKRKPIYSVEVGGSGVIELYRERHATYYRDVVFHDRTLEVFAEEPVQCRYAEGTSTSFDTMVSFGGNPTRFSYVTLPAFSDGQNKQYSVICQDRAGNIGQRKVVSVAVNRGNPPVLIDVPEVVRINQQNINNTDAYRFTFKSERDLNCRYGTSLADITNTITSVQVGSSWEYEVSFSNAAQSVHLLCNLPNSEQTVDKTVRIERSEVLPEIPDSVFASDEGTQGRYAISFDPGKSVDVQIFVNSKLVYAERNQNTIQANIPLDYGSNEVEILLLDAAGNLVTRSRTIFSEYEKPEVYLTNFLSGSVRDSYRGYILANTSLPNDTAVAVSMGENTVDVPVSFAGFKDELQAYSLYLSREQLFDLTSGTSLAAARNSDGYMFFDQRIVDIATLSLDLNGNEYTEIFFYNPLAESLDFTYPEYAAIVNASIVNFNQQKVQFRSLHENYVVNILGRFALQQETLSLTAGRYEATRGRFDSFSIRLTTDLGIQTVVLSSLTDRTQGPDIFISINPTGDVTYSPTPQFRVSFSTLSKIVEASIQSANLSRTYTVDFNPESGILRTVTTSQPLSDEGSYVFNVLVEDRYGNTVDRQFPFTYIDLPLSVRLVEPKYNVSPTTDTVLKFEADRHTLCEYSDGGDFESFMQQAEIEFDLALIIPNNTERTIVLRCKSPGDEEYSEFSYTVSVDTEPPVISDLEISNAEMVDGVPVITTYPLQANIEVTANKPVFCRYDFGTNTTAMSTNFSQMTDGASCPQLSQGIFCFDQEASVRVSGLAARESYRAAVVCVAPSGLKSTPRQITFRTDLGEQPPFRIIDPSSFMSVRRVPIIVEGFVPLQACYYGSSQNATDSQISSTNSTFFNDTLSGNLDPGNHSVYVRCTLDGKDYTVRRNFMIDITPPVLGTIVHSSTTTSLTTLQATAVNFSDPESGIKYYEYAIGTAPHGQANYNSVLNWTQSTSNEFVAENLNLTNGQTYYWSVRAVNNALMVSSVRSSTGIQVQTSGPGGLIPGDEGDSCLVNSDCASPLVCTDNVCSVREIIIENQTTVNETEIINETEDWAVDPPTDIPSQITTSSSRWWLWLLLLLGLLILLGVGGYYGYMATKKDEEDVVTQPPQEFQTHMPPVVDTQAEDRKEALKKILKKKLVEMQKQEASTQKTRKLDAFSESSEDIKENPFNKMKRKIESTASTKELERRVRGSETKSQSVSGQQTKSSKRDSAKSPDTSYATQSRKVSSENAVSLKPKARGASSKKGSVDALGSLVNKPKKEESAPKKKAVKKKNNKSVEQLSKVIKGKK